MSDRPKDTTQAQHRAKPERSSFKSNQDWQEYQRQHDPEGYERWKKDQEQALLARLKERNYGQWIAVTTSDQLWEELHSLESRRIALEREKPLLGPPWKYYAKIYRIIHNIEAVKAQLIGRGEALDTAEGKPTDAATSSKPTSPVGRNIDRLRKECGWSFDNLVDKTGIDKKNILAHVNKGRKPRPSTMKEYAQAFSKELQRKITVADLEK